MILFYASKWNKRSISWIILFNFLCNIYPRDQRAVTHLENVRQLNIRRGFQLFPIEFQQNCFQGFPISHRQLHNYYQKQKIGFLKNFAIFTGKPVLESLFNKVAGLKNTSGGCFCTTYSSGIWWPTIADKIYETMSRNQAKLDRTKKL